MPKPLVVGGVVLDSGSSHHQKIDPLFIPLLKNIVKNSQLNNLFSLAIRLRHFSLAIRLRRLLRSRIVSSPQVVG